MVQTFPSRPSVLALLSVRLAAPGAAAQSIEIVLGDWPQRYAGNQKVDRRDIEEQRYWFSYSD